MPTPPAWKAAVTSFASSPTLRPPARRRCSRSLSAPAELPRHREARSGFLADLDLEAREAHARHLPCRGPEQTRERGEREISKILVPYDPALFAHQRDSDRLLWPVENEISQDGFGCLFHHVEGCFRLLVLPQLLRIESLLNKGLLGARRKDGDRLVPSRQRGGKRCRLTRPRGPRKRLQAIDMLAQRGKLVVQVDHFEAVALQNTLSNVHDPKQPRDDRGVIWLLLEIRIQRQVKNQIASIVCWKSNRNIVDDASVLEQPALVSNVWEKRRQIHRRENARLQSAEESVCAIIDIEDVVGSLCNRRRPRVVGRAGHLAGFDIGARQVEVNIRLQNSLSHVGL